MIFSIILKYQVTGKPRFLLFMTYMMRENSDHFYDLIFFGIFLQSQFFNDLLFILLLTLFLIYLLLN